jgi:HAMP domain-containing protein
MTFYRKVTPSVSRDFNVIILLIFIFIAFACFWVAHATMKDYNITTINAMEREALRIDRALIIEIESASYILQSLARQIVHIGIDDTEAVAELLLSFNRKNAESASDEFLWVDKNQQIIMNSTVGILSKPSDVSDRDYVKKSFTKPWAVNIGRPVRGKVSDIWILPISLGVNDDNGNFIGIIVFSLNLSRLTSELKNIIKESGMNFTIYTNTLSKITSTEEDEQTYEGIEEEKVNPQKIFENYVKHTDLRERTKGIITKPSLLDPFSIFTYYDSSSKYPYIVYLTFNQLKNSNTKISSQHSSIGSKLTARVSQMIIVAGFFLGMIWVVKARLIKPVESLVHTAARVATGKGFSSTLSGSSPIEIERLSHEIKKLADYITEKDRVVADLKMKNLLLHKSADNSRLLARVRVDYIDNITKGLLLPLDQTNKLLQQLTDNINHSDANKCVYEATKTLHYLQQMIEDIRNTSQIEYSSISVRESAVNLSYAVNRAVRQFHDYEQFKHIDVKVNIRDKLPTLSTDEDIFLHIINNILCGIGAALVQGKNILIEVQNAYDDNGNSELSIYFKYLSELRPRESFSDKKAIILSEANKKPTHFPLLKTDAINFALAHMLVSLSGGKLEINTDSNNYSRIYLTYPKNKLV